MSVDISFSVISSPSIHPCLIAVILVLVNCYSVKLTAYVSMVFSGLKLLAIVFIVVVGFITIMIRKSFPDQFLQPFQPLEGHEPSTASVAVALYGVLWAYDGWYAMRYHNFTVGNFAWRIFYLLLSWVELLSRKLLMFTACWTDFMGSYRLGEILSS